MKKNFLISIILIHLIFIIKDKALSDDITNHDKLPSLSIMLNKVVPTVVSINVEVSNSIKEKKFIDQFKYFFSKDSIFCKEKFLLNHYSKCQNEKSNYLNNNIQQIFKTLGSGVIVNSTKGYVVTNSHVIHNAIKIKVKTHNEHTYDAKVIGQDNLYDIALIQLKNFKNLKEIKITNSDNLKVGDYAVAIGNPYGLGETVTSGIISALGRSSLNSYNYENFIQTDAAINRGNSGGALVNLNGELIGMNTAILAPDSDGGNIGIGFAIPSNVVKNLVIQMAKYGKVKRGELGIIGTDLNDSLSKFIKINRQKGAFISQILKNSPAMNSGMKAGDIVVRINRKNISSFAVLRSYIGSLPMNSKVNIHIVRKKEKIIFNIKLINIH